MNARERKKERMNEKKKPHKEFFPEMTDAEHNYRELYWPEMQET